MKSFRSAPLPRSDASRDQIVRLFQSETGEILEAPEPFGVRSMVFVLTAFLIALAVLSLVTRLDRVVTSDNGKIVTTQPTIVVQALDASIIKTLPVREGERVKAGDLLATLDPTFAAADVDALKLQVVSLDAQIDRCEAELADRPFEPPANPDPAVARYGQVQKAYYVQRKAQLEGQVRAYNEQIGQHQANIAKLQNNQSRYNDRAKLAEEVEQMRATLAAAQVGSRLNLLAATDQKTELLRNLEFDHNSLIESGHQLQATVATRDAFIQQWLGQASQELVTARNQRDTARQQLEKAIKRKDLVRLVAPEDSIVLKMAKLSVGSVLNVAEPLLYLAPLRSPVEAEARFISRDVGFLRPGDPVKIKFDAYSYFEHGTAEGTVRWISEGAFTVDDNNQPTPPYYKVRIALTDVKLLNVPESFRLIPGMTLSADVHIGTRSVLMYLVEGAVKTMSEAMREP